jgi:tubulin-like protein CetZ
MRIVAIGLGGAGCRIVDRLYATDRRSSKVACVQALAIDVDEEALSQLHGLPESAKISFSALDVGLKDKYGSDEKTATIDIGEIISKVQNFESGETDAIFICCGLGGTMTDVVPHVVAALRSSVVEPIFGLVTLPCLAEGAKKSSKAADDIDMLEPILDGTILFDNETWYKKIKAEKAHLFVRKERGFAEKMGLKKEEQPISPVIATYNLLNEGIVRRISLILRAGEFRADGGIDLAEVVLDSGEVINTMKGMGFITIGYAVERLPSDPLSFLSRFKPAGAFKEEEKKKASRIVELAKQAIYHEVSIPCDMTSAHKALILVAGPSHELSMKGFMTVRKWIDRSIAGLETRSGDYPVMNTQNVAIIIMLSGLGNIPRITELKEIQEQYKSRQGRGSIVSDRFSGGRDQVIESRTSDESINFSTPVLRDSNRDEMIVLPAKQAEGNAEIQVYKAREMDLAEEPITDSYDLEEAPVMDAKQVRTIRIAENVVKSHPVQQIERNVPKTDSPHPVHHEVSHKDRDERMEDASNSPSYPPIRSGRTVKESGSPIVPTQNVKEGLPARDSPSIPTRTNETERQRIERELQRQRMLVISGNRQKSSTETTKTHTVIASAPTSNPKIFAHSEVTRDTERTTEKTSSRDHERKTVIVSRKKAVPIPKNAVSVDEPEEKIQHSIPHEEHFPAEPVYLNEKTVETINIGLREPVRKAKDEIFSGRDIGRSSVNQVRDSGIIRTHLKIKTGTDDSNRNATTSSHENKPVTLTEQLKKHDKKIQKNDNF